MTDIVDHMRQWGVPKEYRRDFNRSGLFTESEEVQDAVHAVNGIANWYPEQDNALRAMVVAGDIAAINEWADRRDMFLEVGEETSNSDDYEAEAETYADDVVAALRSVVEAITGSGRSGGKR
jgi:hypothetical protein